MTSDLLRRLAGSVVMLGFRGTSAGSGTGFREVVRDLGLGGVILFDRDVESGSPLRNIESPEQTRRLVEELADASDGRLLVAIDQEGGAVSRLHPGNGFPNRPGAAETAATGSVDATRRTAEGIARDLAGCGIRVNFAPVVDLASEPASPALAALGRCYSSDPDVVIAHARAFVDAHRELGVACALKHFPGHGSAVGDTHAGPADVTATHSERELEPFRVLIEEARAPMVMCGHLLHRARDAERPASLSRAWIDDVLRGDFGFDGVVVTDDLDMAAVSAIPLVDRVAAALEAGADCLLFGNNLTHDPDRPRAVVEAVVTALRTGRIDREAVERSRLRLDHLRAERP